MDIYWTNYFQSQTGKQILLYSKTVFSSKVIFPTNHIKNLVITAKIVCLIIKFWF